MKAKNLAPIVVVLSGLLASCASVPKYHPPISTKHTTEFSYSSRDLVMVKKDPVRCQGDQQLPTPGLMASINNGKQTLTTRLATNQLTTLAFSGAGLQEPTHVDINIGNNVASNSAMGMSDEFGQDAQSHCSFMITFIPRKGMHYKYEYKAQNAGMVFGGHRFKCTLKLLGMRRYNLETIPFLLRRPAGSVYTFAGQNSQCSIAGISQNLTVENLHKLRPNTIATAYFDVRSPGAKTMVDTQTGAVSINQPLIHN